MDFMKFGGDLAGMMIRAVICDDEPDAIRLIDYFIKSEGMPIEIVGTAQNGVESLDLIRREKPEIVFMDIHMPYLNGFEIIQQVPKSKFIVITAYGSFEYAQRALRLGVYDILEKPVDFEQLREAIFRSVGWEFTSSSMVNACLTYIHKNYAKKIELEDLAEFTNCTTVHVSRSFRKYTGMPFLAYLNRMRIDRAVWLLEHTDQPVKEIAESVGYQNMNNFYKHFKAQTGYTPAAYAQETLHEKK